MGCGWLRRRSARLCFGVYISVTFLNHQFTCMVAETTGVSEPAGLSCVRCKASVDSDNLMQCPEFVSFKFFAFVAGHSISVVHAVVVG